jgi:hypothetical protein
MISAPARLSQRLTTSASTSVPFPFQKSVSNVVFDTAVGADRTILLDKCHLQHVLARLTSYPMVPIHSGMRLDRILILLITTILIFL